MIMTAATSVGDWDQAEATLNEHLANFEREAGVRCLHVQTGLSRGALVVAWRGDTERARSLIERPRPFEAQPGPIEGYRAQALVSIGRAAEGLALARSVISESPRWRHVEAAHAALLALETLEQWDELGQLAGTLSRPESRLSAHRRSRPSVLKVAAVLPTATATAVWPP